MRWQVQVDGDVDELGRLASRLAGSPIEVVEDGGTFRVSSQRLEALPTPAAVAKRASDEVASVAGMAKLYVSARTPITFEGTVWDAETGTPHKFVFAQTATLEARAFAPGIGGPPPDELRLAADVAASDDAVQEALRCVAQGGWVGLRKARERVLDDVDAGSAKRAAEAVEQRGWAPSGSMERFQQSASKPEASGDDALHVSDPSRPMTVRLMYLPEARSVIGELVRLWIASKHP